MRQPILARFYNRARYNLFALFRDFLLEMRFDPQISHFLKLISGMISSRLHVF